MDTKNSTCPHCSKNFLNIYTMNKHITRVHKIEIERKNGLILCPLCPPDGNRKSMTCYDLLKQHFKDKHDVTLEEERLTFPSQEDFEEWMQLEYRSVDYVIAKIDQHNKMRYYCNRSNFRGHKSKLSKRKPKKKGSIKINGICPARIIAKFHSDGHQVEVFYVKTHVGHVEGELSARRFTYEEENEFADKMRAGVSLDRILEDAKIIQNGKVERKNVAIRSQLRYIARKFNIKIARDSNDVIATTPESHSDHTYYARVYKEIDLSEEELELNEAENEFIDENNQDLHNKKNQEEIIDDETRRKIRLEDFNNRLMSLDIPTFNTFIDKLDPELNKLLPNTSITKRKMEKQNYHSQTEKKKRKQ